jgi:tetratricopeptide (TPR) repeat protein
LHLCAASVLIFCTLAAQSTPIVPGNENEVIEVLPTIIGDRTEARRLQRQLKAAPQDASLAVATARRFLAQAHAMGDPRFAGMAMAAIAGWNDLATMPSQVLLMRGTLQQYLHDFDASAQSLEVLLARPVSPEHAQARLTLATVRRVQGHYGASDQSCRQLENLGAHAYSRACLAENAGLQGHYDEARQQLQGLLASVQLPPPARGWLTTTLAELEQRAGRNEKADAAFRTALALDPDAYTRLAYADFLIDTHRPAAALILLHDEVRSDAVLLRLVMAEAASCAPSAAADATELRTRFALANERPEARLVHGREQAMFALEIEHRPDIALVLAQGNVRHQREPLDLLVLARAAHAASDANAIKAARALITEMDLHDTRIDAAL